MRSGKVISHGASFRSCKESLEEILIVSPIFAGQ